MNFLPCKNTQQQALLRIVVEGELENNSIINSITKKTHCLYFPLKKSTNACIQTPMLSETWTQRQETERL